MIYPVCITFAFSLLTTFRLITYQTGKIPFFMSDTTWNIYKLKYSEDEIDEKYKEMSIAHATTFFALSLIGLLIWIICEILAMIN